MTKTEYEVYLRHGDEEGEFFVDVRKDIVDSNNEIINGGEYIEGEIFDNYDKAKERFSQFVMQFLETGDTVGENNDVEYEKNIGDTITDARRCRDGRGCCESIL